MDWKVSSNDQNPSSRQKKDWRFNYWGESFAPEEKFDTIPTIEDSNSFYPLSQVKEGAQVWVVGFQGKGGMNRLLGMGLTPGVKLQVINTQPSGSVLVAIQDNRIGAGAGIANRILVSDHPLNKSKEDKMTIETRTYLREMSIGTVGCIVGYDKAMRGYKGKLLSMGLTPGTEFTMIRIAPLGDPVEIKVRGFHLSLRKQEADALVVEKVNNEN
jgi:ferrous iron transport protein A